jgi:hypothetical protein
MCIFETSLTAKFCLGKGQPTAHTFHSRSALEPRLIKTCRGVKQRAHEEAFGDKAALRKVRPFPEMRETEGRSPLELRA